MNSYTVLFKDFINQLSLANNLEPVKAVSENIEKLEDELSAIENDMAELKSSTGVIAPANHLAELLSHLYMTETMLTQAKTRVKASRDLLFDSKKRIEKVTDVLKEGEEILVKVIEIDKMGRIRLSRKEAIRDQEAVKS